VLLLPAENLYRAGALDNHRLNNGIVGSGAAMPGNARRFRGQTTL
jgi:hypothetical protein